MIVPSLPQTTAAVAAHYDELDTFYRDVWGEHLHHGYWARGQETAEQAVAALVDLLAERLSFVPGQTVCDIGCGYGAAARQLAERFDCTVTGVTVSACQARVAAARISDSRGPAGQVSIELRDWLANGFPDASFDRAYAIESTEHMVDKQRFFEEAYRALRPGGRLGVCAWLACDNPSRWENRHLLEPICREGRLPGLGNTADYRRMAEQAGFAIESVEDLSDRVRRTWTICTRRLLVKLATQRRYARFLLDPSATNRVFALTLPRCPIWDSRAIVDRNRPGGSGSQPPGASGAIRSKAPGPPAPIERRSTVRVRTSRTHRAPAPRTRQCHARSRSPR